MLYSNKRTIAIKVAAVLGTLAIATNAQAIDFKVSGQVSRMVVAPNDAIGDEVQHQDIGWSGSRFRITGEELLDSGNTIGFKLEQQLQSNPAFASAGGAQTNGGNDDFIDNRLQDVYISGSFGKVSMGKGDGASNGGTESDLSGTALSSSSNHQDNWGNYVIVEGETADENITWDSIFTMNDGISRVNRLRYDTPSFSGVAFSASLDQGNAYELAARYNGNVGSAKMSSAIFYVDAQDFANDAEVFGLSASVLLANGLNATLAWSDRDNAEAGPDQNATTLKLGYKVGSNAFTVDYGIGERGDAEADTVGVTYAKKLGTSTEGFVTYRQLDSDIDNAESVDLAALGFRVKF